MSKVIFDREDKVGTIKITVVDYNSINIYTHQHLEWSAYNIVLPREEAIKMAKSILKQLKVTEL